MPPASNILNVVRLGRMNYAAALALQLRAVDRVKSTRDAGATEEFLFLVEHDPPVITVGRGGDAAHVLASANRLADLGVELHQSSRGGDVTYHGPGQIVAYPVIDLAARGRDIHGYMRNLEEAVIRVLSGYGLTGERDAKFTGVWIGREKICAIGVAVTRWVTYHGLALNVSTSLDHFDLIVPCGIRERGVTSLAKLLARPVATDEVATALAAELADVLHFAGTADAGVEIL
jgi:lipoate-protein ligase B